ncbi:MAG: host attachment protein [Zetaproteobacteria bacterium]|nr:MAG: host attachment protein [Zetaproteobacteria bacterium]
MYHGKPIWVLAANAGFAKLWTAASPSADLEEFKVFENPEARLHERDLTSDLPGRAFDSAGEGRHAMEQQVSPKKEIAIRFAQEIARYLIKNRDAMEKLYVAAGPEFLGLLRQSLNGNWDDDRLVEFSKDYTGLDGRALRSRLPDYL